MITEKLARFVVETPIDDIPASVLDGARDALIDTIGVAIAGTLEPIADIAVAWVRDAGAKRQATFWGQPLGTSPAEAAFVNGMCAHALDFDDSLPSLRGHPSPTMVPAALAVAEVVRAPGAELLAAHALGLEIAGKIGRAMGHGHYLRGWHSTATIGAFSCTAAAARLWKLDVPQLRAAWGLAASQMSGLVRNFGTMTKPFHAGHAARTGVLSAWMAKHGFTAHDGIFDGKSNVLDTYAGEDGASLADVVQSLGAPWEMTEPGIYVKRWPCCYCNHRPIGGLLQLIQMHGIKPDEVNAIEIGFPPGSDTALVSRNPMTGLEGKFSIEYVAAATMLDGKLTLETFTDAMVQRPAVRAMMAKTRRYRIEDEGTFSGVVGYNDVAIDTTRGRFEMRVDKVPGSPAAPMTADDRVEKFMDCAGRVLGTPRAKRLLRLLQRCNDLADARQIPLATVPKRSSKTREVSLVTSAA
ncbi:MAG: MmgE/PrpD family protein [Rhodospirillaceae bacterium]